MNNKLTLKMCMQLLSDVEKTSADLIEHHFFTERMYKRVEYTQYSGYCEVVRLTNMFSLVQRCTRPRNRVLYFIKVKLVNFYVQPQLG